MRQMRANSKKLKERKLSKSWIQAGTLIVLVLVAIGVWWMVRPVKSTPTTPPQPSPAAADTHSVANAGPSHQATPNPSATPISNASHPVSSTLATPTGSILSDATSTPNGPTENCGSGGACGDENSTVSSVPGAVCNIEASMGGVTQQVKAAQSTNSNGNFNIYWSPGQLSAGTWDVWAQCTHDGSTADSAKYPMTVVK